MFKLWDIYNYKTVFYNNYNTMLTDTVMIYKLYFFNVCLYIVYVFVCKWKITWIDIEKSLLGLRRCGESVMDILYHSFCICICIIIFISYWDFTFKINTVISITLGKNKTSLSLSIYTRNSQRGNSLPNGVKIGCWGGKNIWNILRLKHRNST